jgi:fructose-1-phosphate kinase PfkB-like protein
VVIAAPSTYLDAVMKVPTIASPEPVWAEEAVLSAGGKGLNVARALERLGIEADTHGFVAGPTGAAVARLADTEGLRFEALELDGSTPVACILLESGSDAQLVANGPPPAATNDDWQRYSAAVRSALSHEDVRALVCTESLPDGVPEEGHAELIAAGRDAKVRTYLDADGAALAAGIRARPDVVKVNVHEAARLAGRRDQNDSGDAELAALLDVLERKGALNAVVTLGSHGAVASMGGTRGRVNSPETKSVNETGCGDAFTAGLVAGFVDEGDGQEALLTAARTASAAAETLRPADFDPARAATLRSEVRWTRLG